MSYEKSPDYGGRDVTWGRIALAAAVIIAAGLGWAWASGAFGR